MRSASDRDSERDLDLEVRLSKTQKAAGKIKKTDVDERSERGSSDEEASDAASSSVESPSSSDDEDSYREVVPPASQRKAPAKSSKGQRVVTSGIKTASSRRTKQRSQSKPLAPASAPAKRAALPKAITTSATRKAAQLIQPAKVAATEDGSSLSDVDHTKQAAILPPSKPRKKADPRPRASAGSALDEQLATADLDVCLPSSSSRGTAGECCILVQIDPDDASALDLEGATGAVGRLETDESGVILDLKGCQYRGTIFPCATAVVLSLASHKKGTTGSTAIAPHWKIDHITDEFCRLVKTGDAMDQMSARVIGDVDNYRLSDDEPVAGIGGDGNTADLAFPSGATSSSNDAPRATAKISAKKAKVSTAASSKKRKSTAPASKHKGAAAQKKRKVDSKTKK